MILRGQVQQQYCRGRTLCLAECAGIADDASGSGPVGAYGSAKAPLQTISHLLEQGGCQLPYAKIEIDMREEPGSWIEERRMPPGVKILRDMRHWTRAELNGWLSLFIASQSGDLPPDRRFEMTQVPQKGSRPPKNIQGQPLPHVDAWEYGWTSDELLYAQRMTSHPEGNIQHEEHHGLPPARRSHIYSPFQLDLFEALISTHAEHPGMIALIKEVAAIGLCEIDPPGNPHVPRATEHSLSNSLQPAPWLTAAFYDPTSPNHLRWSIKTLQDWVLVRRPHIHRLSNTVYGGPLGIRVLVFACSRILQNLDRAGSRRLAPRETQVAASRATLQRSSGARAELWEREVLIRLEQRVDSVEHSESEYRVSTTSGVPGDFRVLEEMAAYIKQQPNRDGPHQADPDSDNEEFEVASR
ncbi:hypothetical protein FRC08_006300 [Ceratobasidium sp. 394]|nr:hypothetical protein FRC08_006300 [Ceratobasidium sp. 394]